MKTKKKRINSLYIHIPFCSKICPYCDFTKIIKNSKFEDEYIKVLLSELSKVEDNFFRVKTIYIGGGTPSSLKIENLTKLLIKLNKLRKKECEFTIELNPEDITEELLSTLKKYNINRLSIGIQSFNRRTLNLLHRADLNFKCIINLVKKYFENINLDFIYGLPFEEKEDILNNLEEFLDLDVPHISIYSLTISKGTEFYNKGYKEIDEDLNREFYDLIRDKLINKGYIHYEVSNFAKPKYESKHNLNYWFDNEYVGIGLGASGYIGNKRYIVTKNLSKFNSYNIEINYELLTLEEEVEEYIMLNLRTRYGISYKKFEKRFSFSLKDKKSEMINKLKNEKLISENKYGFKVTYEGMAILDRIIVDLIS